MLLLDKGIAKTLSQRTNCIAIHILTGVYPNLLVLEGSSLELLCKGHLMEEVCFAVKTPGAADLSQDLLVQAL